MAKKFLHTPTHLPRQARPQSEFLMRRLAAKAGATKCRSGKFENLEYLSSRSFVYFCETVLVYRKRNEAFLAHRDDIRLRQEIFLRDYIMLNRN